jgi:hypothetical protein
VQLAALDRLEPCCQECGHELDMEDAAASVLLLAVAGGCQ